MIDQIIPKQTKVLLGERGGWPPTTSRPAKFVTHTGRDQTPKSLFTLKGLTVQIDSHPIGKQMKSEDHHKNQLFFPTTGWRERTGNSETLRDKHGLGHSDTRQHLVSDLSSTCDNKIWRHKFVLYFYTVNNNPHRAHFAIENHVSFSPSSSQFLEKKQQHIAKFHTVWTNVVQQLVKM